MKRSVAEGFSFGLTSGVITTLGMIVGLNAGTSSQAAVIGGILTIAIADGLSDALGMHLAQESAKSSERSIWESTVTTFLAKFLFSSHFILPMLFLPEVWRIPVSIVWGMLLLAVFSYYVGTQRKESPWKSVGEHVFVGIIALLLSQGVGMAVAYFL